VVYKPVKPLFAHFLAASFERAEPDLPHPIPKRGEDKKLARTPCSSCSGLEASGSTARAAIPAVYADFACTTSIGREAPV